MVHWFLYAIPYCLLKKYYDLRNLSTSLVSSNFSFRFFSVTQIQIYNRFNSTIRNMFYKQLNSCAAVNNSMVVYPL